MTTKKKHLTSIEGGSTPSKRAALAVSRPLIRVVPASEVTPKTLRASDYLGVSRTCPGARSRADVMAEGRSRIYPEINVLNSAKGWHQGMLRLARNEGYTDMKKFFKQSGYVTAADGRLFFVVAALIEYENTLPKGGRNGPGR